MQSWFFPLPSIFSPLKSFILLFFLALINGTSNINAPSDQGPLSGQQKVDHVKDISKDSDVDQAFFLNSRMSLQIFPTRLTNREPVFAPYFEREPAALPDLAYQCSDATVSCQSLSAHCLICDVEHFDDRGPNCTYGDPVVYTCRVKATDISCQGERTFEFLAPCRYCYQTDTSEHSCVSSTVNCHVAGLPYNQRFRTNCTVNHDVVCIGHRRFYKSDKCNFSTGYRWSIAMLLSVTVGGFGGDRFYLGHWREGIGKLFSFGGLGIWTLVDIILIAIGYLRPEDGSVYIDL